MKGECKIVSTYLPTPYFSRYCRIRFYADAYRTGLIGNRNHQDPDIPILNQICTVVKTKKNILLNPTVIIISPQD